MEAEREFPDWKELYRDEDVETMPWYYPGLDPDFERTLDELGITSGTVLDLGTGPATQAIALAQRGFRVTATDIADAALKKARIKAGELRVNIDFRQDDILDSALGKTFDIVLDRGVFHVLSPRRRPDYLDVISRLVKPGGYLFLKCFSERETRKEGPYRFSSEKIEELFGGRFDIRFIRESEFPGMIDPHPKALFSVMVNPGINT